MDDDNDEYYLHDGEGYDLGKIRPDNAYYVNAYFSSFPHKDDHANANKKKNVMRKIKKVEKDIKNSSSTTSCKKKIMEHVDDHKDVMVLMKKVEHVIKGSTFDQEQEKTTIDKPWGRKRSRRLVPPNDIPIHQENMHARVNDVDDHGVIIDHNPVSNDNDENRIQENILAMNNVDQGAINPNPAGIIANDAIAAAIHNPVEPHQPDLDNNADIGVLVFKKQLTRTDTSKHHNRLLIPKNQLLHEFLTVDEERTLVNEQYAVVPGTLVFSNNEYDIQLRRQKVGTNSSCYTIGSPWNQIREDNGLETGMKVELTASRRGGQRLWLTLTRSQE